MFARAICKSGLTLRNAEVSYFFVELVFVIRLLINFWFRGVLSSAEDLKCPK